MGGACDFCAAKKGQSHHDLCVIRTLRAERDDLKRRVRLAKAALVSDRAAHVRCAEALGVLTKPLPKGRR